MKISMPNMKTVEPSFEILWTFPTIEDIEKIARVCYKSEKKICEGSAAKLIRNMLNRTPKHETPLEHSLMTVKFICNRGISHEIVRHRICAYSMESSRYVDYNKAAEEEIERIDNEADRQLMQSYGKNLRIIRPEWLDQKYCDMWESGRLVFDETNEKEVDSAFIFLASVDSSCYDYVCLRENGIKAEHARDVLPHALKTEIVMSANFREWRHVFSLRCD